MEKWQQRVQKPPVRRGCDYPSFSSTLLDSIYRSIDAEPDHRGAPDPDARKKQAFSLSPEHKWAPQTARPKPARGGPELRRAVTRPRSATSSSSECSSYGGFSSSEPESAPKPNRLRPVRTGPDPPPAEIKSKTTAKKMKNLSSIRSKLRDLQKSRSPTSPAARLAGFLNSLFTSKQQRAAAAAGAAASEESACSTASSYSRSCLARGAAAPPPDHAAVKRSVRFQLPVDGGSKAMKWRDLEAEDDDVASDASSDLFELENLTAVGRYRDELPVYETTRIGGLFL